MLNLLKASQIVFISNFLLNCTMANTSNDYTGHYSCQDVLMMAETTGDNGQNTSKLAHDTNIIALEVGIKEDGDVYISVGTSSDESKSLDIVEITNNNLELKKVLTNNITEVSSDISLLDRMELLFYSSGKSSYVTISGLTIVSKGQDTPRAYNYSILCKK